MLWTDLESPPQIPLDIQLRFQPESVARCPHDAARHAKLGNVLMALAKYADAAAAFERAEALGPSDFRQFDRLARCYIGLKQPDAALEVCERGNEVMPNCAELHAVRGIALGALGRETEARAAFLEALALSRDAFEAAECLLFPLAADPDGGDRLLALCEEFPPTYANSTVVRGYRAIALSRVGRVDEARSLVDLERHPTRVTFEPPAEFGGIERFNALLADEILRNPGLRRHTSDYGFYRTEQLAILGARAFPVLAKFLRSTIENYIAEFADRGLDVILPPPPREGFLYSAGNIVRAEEDHSAHLHKYAYISGVYHVSVPPDEAAQAHNRAGAMVLGPFAGYVPCWGSRDIQPIPGVATLLPSHIFHSVAPTHSEQPRIAIPFDLCVGTRLEVVPLV
jgi:tetratricopeptide (TPR) repeat protein